RTDVSTSNDKHANNETAYILQKMEEYDGLSIMATNLYQNFDTAFLRRITYTLRFENPDSNMRLSLFKKVLPKEVPVDPKLDFSVFSERLELSGANIKSIMYAAAYMAAAQNKSVDAECVVRAAKYELRKLGRMVNASDFGPYGGLF
ncbi:MAG: AAA family ATPase, partial [Lachnospiraceae bacterium]|nr:AAA family ATPase [Lachnospiraceae bacterium]